MASPYDALLDSPPQASPYDALLESPADSPYDALLDESPVSQASPESASPLLKQADAEGFFTESAPSENLQQFIQPADPTMGRYAGISAIGEPYALDNLAIQSAEDMTAVLRGPLLTLPKPENTGIVTGIVRGVENVAEGLTSPENIALLASLGGAPAAVQRIASAGFAGLMGKGAIEGGQAAIAAPTAGEAAERGTEALVSAAMAGLAGSHALKGLIKPVPPSLIVPPDLSKGTSELARIQAEPGQPPSAPIIPEAIDGLLVARRNTTDPAAIAEIDAQLRNFDPALVTEAEARVAQSRTQPAAESAPATPEVQEGASTELAPERVVRRGEASVETDEFSQPGHAYRGMTQEEFSATVGNAGKVQSRGDYRLAGEGTNFAEKFPDAESYINFGRDDPRKTGKPTYIIETNQEGLSKNRRGEFEASEGVTPTRIWKVESKGNELVAKEITASDAQARTSSTPQGPPLETAQPRVPPGDAIAAEQTGAPAGNRVEGAPPRPLEVTAEWLRDTGPLSTREIQWLDEMEQRTASGELYGFEEASRNNLRSRRQQFGTDEAPAKTPDVLTEVVKTPEAIRAITKDSELRAAAKEAGVSDADVARGYDEMGVDWLKDRIVQANEQRAQTELFPASEVPSPSPKEATPILVKKADRAAKNIRDWPQSEPTEGYETVFMPYGPQGKGYYHKPISPAPVEAARATEQARKSPLEQLRELEGEAEPTPTAPPTYDKAKVSAYASKLPEGPKSVVRDVLLNGKTVEEAAGNAGMTVAKAQEAVTKAQKFVPAAKTVEPLAKERSYEDEPSAGGRTDAIDEVVSGETQGGIAAGGPLLPNTAPSAPVVPVKAMSQIIRDISKGINVPIRFGRLTTSKFAGYFKKVQNLIGAKSANDISIVSHETGHKLDAAFGISKMPALRAEMEALGDPATPGSRSSWTPSKSLKYKHGEGMAEFVRHWLTDPAKAAKDAPLTNKYFESVMDANPDFGDVMRTAREDVQNWRNAPAEARLDSSISVGDNPNQTRYRLPQLTRDLVDDLHMLKMAVDDATKLSGANLSPSDNPYLLSRLLRGSYGMADSFIRNGAADFNTRAVKLGTSFEDAVKPVSGRINEFRRWVVAKRAQELRSQGRETGLVPADVDFVANKYGADPVFQKAFDDVKKWNDALLQYAVDSGYVSKDSAAAMRTMNQDYVPFHRIFEIGAGESPSQTAGGTGRGLNVGKAGSLNRLTGSARDIVDPLETMIKNAYVLITASEKAAINRAIGDLANKPGMGKWVEEIAAPKEAVKVQLEKVRKDLEAAGADLSAVPDNLVMQFFQNSGKAPFGENVIKVTSDGKTKFYRLKSDLYDAFNALDLDDSSRLIQVLSQPAQVLRAGVTLDPAFGLANVMRDALGSAVINRYGMLPFEASARGVTALMKNPKLVAEWAASGGEQSFEASFFDRKKMAKFMRERITKDLTPAEQALVVVKSPLTALRYLSGMAEAATRIGEFERAFKENVRAGMTEGEARRQASFESRDRQDFAKGGAKTKILRHMAAFWNAGLQGNVAVAKAFKERPVRSTVQGLAYVTLPTVALMAMNYKNGDYWDRPQWERDAFWLMPIGKDANNRTSFLRIPKPFIIGQTFGTLPERMMKFQMTKDPEAFRGLMENTAKEVIPNPMPQTAQVIVSDALTGKQGWDMWRNRPVVPDSMADLPPELQWTEQTSLTAKKIGGALGFSPMKVDHIIAGTTGGLGRQVVHNAIDQAIGLATGEKPTAANVVPGARFFTTPAGISSQAVETFYEQLGKLREQKSAVKVTGTAMNSSADRKRLKMERTADKMAALRKEAKQAKSADEKQRKYLEIAALAKEAIR